jgi:putative transposase
MPTRLHRHDDPGHIHFLTISCYHRLPFFGSDQVRQIVVDCMGQSRRRLGFRWIGYVVMPEHVHWLIYPHPPGCSNPIPISKIILSLKTSIGMQVNQALREVWRQRQSFGHPSLDRWATAPCPDKPIWTTRGIDVNLTDHDQLLTRLHYCHNNPVRRRLVERPEDWIWGSFRYYERMDTAVLKMDWDGRWPLDS